MTPTSKRRAYRTQLRRQIRNAKQRDHMHNNGICAPAAGWKLIARRRLTAGGTVYPAGSEILASECGRNIRALLDSGAIWWAPPSQPISAKPTTLPPQAKPQPKPTIEFVDIPDDPEASWRQTLALMTEKCGSHSAAVDLLMSNSLARDLCKRATRAACAAEARKRRRVSISPSMIGL
jgi:hypothetical protein